MRAALRRTHPLIATIAFAAIPLTLALALTLGLLFSGGAARAATTSGVLVAATAASTGSGAATTTLSTTATATTLSTTATATTLSTTATATTLSTTATATTATVPDIATTAATVRSATVLVLNLDGGGTTQAAGTGFIIDASGLIVTNNHVVSGAAGVQVQLPAPDDRTFTAQIRRHR